MKGRGEKKSKRSERQRKGDKREQWNEVERKMEMEGEPSEWRQRKRSQK